MIELLSAAAPGPVAQMQVHRRGKAPVASEHVNVPVWHEKHLRAATHAAGVALWSWNVDTDAITMDEHA